MSAVRGDIRVLHSSPRPRRVLVVLLPDVHLQDMAGPVQVLHEAAQLGGAYELSFHSMQPHVRSAQGLVLSHLAPLPLPQPGDLVLIPGICSASIDRLDAPCAWLRQAHAAGARLAAVCSGAFALAQAGLLDGRRCTTHWKMAGRLRDEYPRARLLENRIYVEDGGIITCAGVASGIDLALALVEEDHGPIVVSRVAREMVVYLRRSGDEEQCSVYLDHRTHLHPGVHRVQDFLLAHPERRVSSAELARIAAMSPRNLTRVFHRATGITPKQFATKVKVQLAHDLIDDPQRTIEAIAASCGFENGRQLRRLWKQVYGGSIRHGSRGQPAEEHRLQGGARRPARS
jgi:transcriptional regulator GlxA family with amidase domain